MRFLAQVEALSFTQLGIAVVCVLVLAAAGLIGKKLFVGDPPWATRKDVKEDVDVLHERIDRLAQERKVSAARLHEKLEQNISSTSEMKGELKMLNQNVANLASQFSQWLQNHAKR